MNFNNMKPSFFFKIIVLTFLMNNSQAVEGNGIICLNPGDKAGQQTEPRLYFFEEKKVQQFVFEKVIKPGAILASEKNIILQKSKVFRLRAPRPNYIYWQEGNQTMILNTETFVLKIKVLDKKIKILECLRSTSKTEFYSKMMKWNKLYNLRLNSDSLNYN